MVLACMVVYKDYIFCRNGSNHGTNVYHMKKTFYIWETQIVHEISLDGSLQSVFCGLKIPNDEHLSWNLNIRRYGGKYFKIPVLWNHHTN